MTPPRKTCKQIMREVTEKHGYTIEELLAPGRGDVHIQACRFEAMARATEETKLSQSQIAARFKRTRSAVANAVARHKAGFGRG